MALGTADFSPEGKRPEGIRKTHLQGDEQIVSTYNYISNENLLQNPKGDKDILR